MSPLTSLRGAPKLKGMVDINSSQIRPSDKDKYMKGSIWVRKIGSGKEYPEEIIIIHDTFFIDNLPITIYVKIFKNKKPIGESLSILPDIFQENYEFVHRIKEKDSSVSTLPPIVKQGGARSTGKTIQYLGRPRAVYVGSKGGKFIYTDASHKNKKYIK